jgi:hypothetical protein
MSLGPQPAPRGLVHADPLQQRAGVSLGRFLGSRLDSQADGRDYQIFAVLPAEDDRVGLVRLYGFDPTSSQGSRGTSG